MTTLALIAATMLALTALGFTAGAVLFLIKSRAARQSVETDASLPKAAILLALRGPDAHLADCIRSLLNQDYPDYELHIVVDSNQDPAWDIVNRVLEEEGATNVHLSLLRDPLFTCGLKCSALLQMLAEIDKDVEVLALIDGDVVPHRRWLEQLAAPLGEKDIGATFGVPWYFPKDAGWASLARKVCWIPAAILMSLCGWLWGGTAALPARVFRDPALAERWSQSVSSDASIRELIHARSLRLKYISSLIMPNFDAARFGVLINQVARSLTTSRLYLNRWPVTLMAVGISAGTLLFAIVVCTASAVAANGPATAISAAALGAYLLVLLGLLLLVEESASSIAGSNGITIPPMNTTLLAKLLPIIPLAHGIYLVAAIKAQFARSLTWRGVRYAINGRLDVQRLEPVAALKPLTGSAYVVVNDETDTTEIGSIPGVPVESRLTSTHPSLPGKGAQNPREKRRQRQSTEALHE